MQLWWDNAEGQNCTLKTHNEVSGNFFPNLNGVKALRSFFSGKWLTLAYPSHKLKHILQPNFKYTANFLALLELFFPSFSEEKNQTTVAWLLLLAKERNESTARVPIAGTMVYIYINKLSFFILLFLLWPWDMYTEVKKAGTTNVFRCNATECCVMQLFHIFSNAKPGKKVSVVVCGIQVLSYSLG